MYKNSHNWLIHVLHRYRTEPSNLQYSARIIRCQMVLKKKKLQNVADFVVIYRNLV